MKKFIVTLLTLIILSTTNIAVHAEQCNELLRMGYTNINHSVNQFDSVVSAYRHFCNTRYDTASVDEKNGLETSFTFLTQLAGKLGFNWSKNLNQTTWSQICEDESAYQKLYTFSSADSIEISNAALSAWQNCLALNARGLKSEFTPTQDLTGLTASLYWTGSSAISFLGIDNNGLGTAQCTVTAFVGKKYLTIPVEANTNFKLGTKAANFNCKRATSLDADNRITADATRITFKTTEGKLDVDLSPITLRQIDATEINSLYEKIDGLEKKDVVFEASLNDLKTNTVAGQLVYSTSNLRCDDAIKRLDAMTGNLLGFSYAGSSSVMLANDGSWMYETQNQDCSPLSNSPDRATATVTVTTDGKPVKKYWNLNVLP